jgi:hypothetical protein
VRDPRQHKHACGNLGITPLDIITAPQVTPFLDKIGGRNAAIEVLRSCPAPEARAFMEKYDQPDLSLHAQSTLPFEAFCVAAKVCPSRMVEIVVGAMA